MLLCQHRELREPLRRWIKSEFGRREGRIVVMRSQDSQRCKCFGLIQLNNLRQKRVGGDRLDIIHGENLFWKIG